MAVSARQAIEIFHLVFLRALVAKGEDKRLFALKGGCNLRFYFDSTRYSEDLDIDVAVVAKETLKNKVDRLLISPLLLVPLKTKGLEVVESSTPKQTDTTQRWKLGLRVQDLAVPVRTKVEFSRRGNIDGATFEPVRENVLRPYGLTPFLTTHYELQAAVTQKIHALAGRTEPQARDVFDLNLLLSRSDASSLRLTKSQRVWLTDAIERAMSISFDDYASQVVAYLDPDQAELYSDRNTWDTMQASVVTRLEVLQ